MPARVGAPALAAKTLIYGNAGNIDSASNRFAKKWLDLVSERTGGDLAFDIKAGTIGGGKDVLDGTALGTVQIYNGAYTGLREFDVFYAPHFARDSNHAQKIANELLYDELNAAVQKRYPSLRYLSVARAGPWKLFTNTKLEAFDDLKGMKIRAPEIEGVIAGLQQVGAKPTVIPFNELEPQDFFRATEEAEITNCQKWRELNGEDTTPLLDASQAQAQATLAPAIKALADDIFGEGTYDRIQVV